ncbi:hypothetical protein HYPSUDRAFT_85656 [Hypholoma sublateritium FD-334 SS-4]|uniref:Uncharacterized protein n=1 Tax=Hypholoma sublateritium (strain FD-334 SS-4) TaxID=945553 RepID=A0A0D2MMQ4_HYPSF|nr:hypothetical protein HYPSUDRAFT_85656 [Hypholoma sublateritium FD-334 SS-4]
MTDSGCKNWVSLCALAPTYRPRALPRFRAGVIWALSHLFSCPSKHAALHCEMYNQTFGRTSPTQGPLYSISCWKVHCDRAWTDLDAKSTGLEACHVDENAFHHARVQALSPFPFLGARLHRRVYAPRAPGRGYKQECAGNLRLRLSTARALPADPGHDRSRPLARVCIRVHSNMWTALGFR